MGFFNGIKRAFGFSDNGDEHDDELDGIDGRAARSPYVNPFRNDTSPAERHDAQPLMNRYGVQGMVRASFAAYNTLDEVHRFVEAVRRVSTMF